MPQINDFSWIFSTSFFLLLFSSLLLGVSFCNSSLSYNSSNHFSNLSFYFII